MKNTKRRAVAAALAFTLIGNAVALTSCTKKTDSFSIIDIIEVLPDTEKIQKIYGYYGDNSLEAETVEYLKVAKELEKYNFINVPDYSGNSIIYVWDPSVLHSPKDINDILYSYNKAITAKNKEEEKALAIILKSQKQLLNNYLNEQGLLIVFNNFSEALKQNISVQYNLSDYSNLNVYRNENSSTGSYSYVGVYNIAGSSEEKTFNISKDDLNSIRGIDLIIALLDSTNITASEKEELYIKALASSVEYKESLNVISDNYAKQR